MSPRFPDGLVIQQWFKERNPQLTIAMAVSNGRDQGSRTLD
jgi:glc operon protein GlcG